MSKRKLHSHNTGQTESLRQIGQHGYDNSRDSRGFNYTRQHGHVSATVGSTRRQYQKINTLLQESSREFGSVDIAPGGY